LSMSKSNGARRGDAEAVFFMTVFSVAPPGSLPGAAHG
jgi:hypothetical protein